MRSSVNEAVMNLGYELSFRMARGVHLFTWTIPGPARCLYFSILFSRLQDVDQDLCIELRPDPALLKQQYLEHASALECRLRTYVGCVREIGAICTTSYTVSSGSSDMASLAALQARCP